MFGDEDGFSLQALFGLFYRVNERLSNVEHFVDHDDWDNYSVTWSYDCDQEGKMDSICTGTSWTGTR